MSAPSPFSSIRRVSDNKECRRILSLNHPKFEVSDNSCRHLFRRYHRISYELYPLSYGTFSSSGGIRTHDTELPYTGFRVRRIRPLCHPSASREKMDCICAYKKKQGRRPRKAFPCSTASLSLAERQYITSPPERSFPCRSCRDAAPQESSRNHRHSDSFPTQPRAYGRQRDRNH